MVQREDGSGKRRTLHRNLLLPIGCIDSDYEEKRPIPKPRSRTQQEERKEKDRKTDSDQQNEEADRYESSDSESDIQLAVPVQKRTPIEDAREPTVRWQLGQKGLPRKTLHPKLRRLMALGLDQAIRKRIQKIHCEDLLG